MTTDLMLQRICLRPVSQEMARETVEGQRHDDWAPDYPTDGDVFISSVVLRAIDAGVAYRPPSLALPWTGPWQICVRGEAGETIVGGIGFKGGPVDGTVEIGYGIAESARGRGYVTDAVMALLQLVGDHEVSVVAETEPGNDASERVLQRCGFVVTHTAADGNLWWRAA